MIHVYVQQDGYGNEIRDLVRAFYPHQEIKEADVKAPDDDQLCIAGGFDEKQQNCFYFYAQIQQAGQQLAEKTLTKEFSYHSAIDRKRKVKNILKGCVYDVLVAYTKREIPWGILTGIRPTKIVHQLMDQGQSEDAVRDVLKGEYRIHSDKIALLMKTASLQRPYLQPSDRKFVSVYLHIPFCTSKCLYCSFPSDLIGRVSHRMEDFLQCLEKEVSQVTKAMLQQGLVIDNIYIGGGTPTALSHLHLERLLLLVRTMITDKNPVLEYTVEAGRPDSLDREKLLLLKRYGVTRLSINPQTMNQDTLIRIGRGHSVDDIYTCYAQAREIGFDSINMDVIIGLPGEGAEEIRSTMQGIAVMKPDNLTIHTLAVKRASTLKEYLQDYKLPDEGEAEEMAEIFRTGTADLGLIPYYLYRQKNMLDNLENVGYTSPGHECLYNIHIMEEKRSIWAFGAGAISKIYYEVDDRLERLVNVKNTEEYILRIEEMIEKKQKVLSAY